MDIIIEVGVKVIGALAVTLISVAGAWAASKLGQVKQAENVTIAISEVENAARLTVLELQQTLVDDLKASAADGKLTEQEKRELGNLLVKKSIEKLSAPSEALLRAAGVDIEKVIQGAGEALIAQIKRR